MIGRRATAELEGVTTTRVIHKDGVCMLVRRMRAGTHGQLHSAEISAHLGGELVERAVVDAPSAEELDRLVASAVDAFAAAARLRHQGV